MVTQEAMNEEGGKPSKEDQLAGLPVSTKVGFSVCPLNVASLSVLVKVYQEMSPLKLSQDHHHGELNLSSLEWQD